MRKLITLGFLYIYIIIVGLHYFTCAGNGLRLRHVVSSASRHRRPHRRKAARVITLLVNDPGRAVLSPRHTDIPRHLGGTEGFVITSLTHAGDFGIAERALPHTVFGTRAIFLLLLTLHKL